MKKINLYIGMVFILSAINTKAQTINWNSIGTDTKHIFNANVGTEYGLVYGIGYGYHINSNLPTILFAEYSFPSGNKLTDDFKSKIGGTIRLYKFKDFLFSASIHGIFRRYENDYVRLMNFGGVATGNIGFYKPKWFASLEFGFDKAIVTNFKHSQFYKDNYPLVVDGWYKPTTGGNFCYNLQIGYSLKKHDIYLKFGKIIAQDFNTVPSFPVLGQIGYNFKFNYKNK
jgi:hypothetical protein